MTDFEYIDQTAYAEDEVLDTFIIDRTRTNLEACRTERPIAGAWTPCAFNTSTGSLLTPDVSCMPGLLGAAMLYPFWIAPGCTEIRVNVEVRCTTTVTANPYTSETVLRVAVQPLGSYTAQGSPSFTETDIAGNASVSVTKSVDVDVSSLPRGWALVWVSIQSGTGTETELQDAGGSGPNALTDYFTGYVILDDSASNVLGSLTGGASVPAWMIRIRDTLGKASLALGGEEQRQAIHITDAGSGSGRYNVWVYKVMHGSRTIGATDSLWYTPLGQVEVHAVSIREKTVSGLPTQAALVDATQPVSGRNLHPVVREQSRDWLARPRLYAIGPYPKADNTDWTGNHPHSLTRPHVVLTTSYQTLAECVVGDDDLYGQRARTGTLTQYVKTAVDVLAQLLVTLATDAPAGPYGWNLKARIRFTDRDGSSNAVAREFPLDDYPVICTPAFPFFAVQLSQWDHLAYLASFALDDPDVLHRSAFSSFLPESLWQADTMRGGVSLWRALDTSTSGERLLQIQIKASNSTANQTAGGAPSEYAPIVHLMSFGVAGMTELTREPPVSELGVTT